MAARECRGAGASVRGSGRGGISAGVEARGSGRGCRGAGVAVRGSGRGGISAGVRAR